jgi:LPXTG-site transpeptidase (sortase) family protein
MIKQLKKFFDPKLNKKTIDPKRTKKATLFYNPSKKRSFIFGIGSGLVIIGIASFLYLYIPLIVAYTNYYRLPQKTSEHIPAKPTSLPSPPVDYEDFYISIPKINGSAQVFANTSATNKENYLEVLKKGVAHTKGTGFPGQEKTIFLFAHSTNASYNIVRYNAVFFLLDKLEPKDDVIVFFNNDIYKYKVTEKKIVSADETKYLTYKGEKETLILQTCWPPGTIWKRLLVLAEINN